MMFYKNILHQQLNPSTGIGTQEVQPTDNSAFEAMDARIADWTPPPPPPK